MCKVEDRAVRRAVEHVAADDAARFRQEPYDREAGDRLAGAGFADDGNRLTAVDPKAHSIDRLRDAVAELEMRPQIDNVQNRVGRHFSHRLAIHPQCGQPVGASSTEARFGT